MRFVMAGVLLVASIGITGEAAASTAHFGGDNAEAGEVCAGGSGTTLVQAESQPALSYAAPFSGVITRWGFVSGDDVASPIKLKVFRRTASPGELFTVGESAPITPAAHTHATFPTGIPVAAGDLLGLRTTTGAATDCSVVSRSFDDLLRGSIGPDPPVGTTASGGTAAAGKRLAVGATVETDLDRDGLGDDTQDGDDDGDGAADGADNCPLAANAGQENADGDGQGDVCDDDDDNDGLPDAIEALLGTADTTRPRVALARVPATVKRPSFLKGVRVTATPDEPVALKFELLGSARGATLSRNFNLVLAHRALPLAEGARAVRLKPNRRLVGSRRRFTVRLRVTATDASRNVAIATRTLRVR